ncbi:hypothetical protein Tco_0650673 [Tanacetum coccineum]
MSMSTSCINPGDHLLRLSTNELVPLKQKQGVREAKLDLTRKTPLIAKGKRLKTSAKAAKPSKKKQPAKTSNTKGLRVLSEVALTEAEQIKLATKRSLIQTHSSYACSSGEDEGTSDSPGVLSCTTYESVDDAKSLRVSGQDDDNEKTDSDNDGDEFVHPKFSTHDQEESKMKKIMKKRMFRFTNYVETLFPLHQHFLHHQFFLYHLQTNTVTSPTTVPSSSLHDLPNFVSLFGFDHRLKTLENDFLEFNQMNQFAAAVSLIPGIVDTYLANKMNESVKTVVQLQPDRLRNEAQADNKDFINKLDDNIKKIIKEQVKRTVNGTCL